MRETNREGGSGGDKGQSHTIKLCSVGLQRPTSYSHAVLNYTNLSASQWSHSSLVSSSISQKSCLDTLNGI